MERRRKPRSSWSRSATELRALRVRRLDQPAGGAGLASTGGPGVPRRSRRARGAGTTRRQSAPGRGAAEGLARCSAAPAASRPRRARYRAGSGAQPRGAGRRTATARLAKASSSPCCARTTSAVSMSPSARCADTVSAQLNGYGQAIRRDDSMFAADVAISSFAMATIELPPELADLPRWGFADPGPLREELIALAHRRNEDDDGRAARRAGARRRVSPGRAIARS